MSLDLHQLSLLSCYSVPFSLTQSLIPPSFSQKDVYLRGDPSNEARVQRLNIDIEHLDMGIYCPHWLAKLAYVCSRLNAGFPHIL